MLLAFPGASLAAVPEFIVHTADGKDIRGPIVELGADWAVKLGGEKSDRIPGAEVITIRRADSPLPAMPVGRQMFLANGDRLPVEAVRLESEKLYFRHPDLNDSKEASLPLGAAAVVWLAAPANADDPERLRHRLVTASRTRDQILLRNGDVLEGVLGGLDAKKVEIEVNGKQTTLDLTNVAAVALSSELVETLRPKGPFARVTLLSGPASRGTRLSLRSAAVSGEFLTGETLFGARLRVGIDQVASLALHHGRAVYLSDLKPVRYEFEPFLGARWSFVADGSVAGRDLRVGGGTFDKGIGMHSKSRLTYKTAGEYRFFEALVGLDDQTGRGGSVRVRVLADGKPLDLGEERELTVASGPLPVRVPVKGVKELTLEVDFGQRGDVQDHVNWADARLIK